MNIKARLSVITRGVADFDCAFAFCRDGLGPPTDGIIGRELDHGAATFLDLFGGPKLGIWPQADLDASPRIDCQAARPRINVAERQDPVKTVRLHRGDTEGAPPEPARA